MVNLKSDMNLAFWISYFFDEKIQKVIRLFFYFSIFFFNFEGFLIFLKQLYVRYFVGSIW